MTDATRWTYYVRCVGRAFWTDERWNTAQEAREAGLARAHGAGYLPSAITSLEAVPAE